MINSLISSVIGAIKSVPTMLDSSSTQSGGASAVGSDVLNELVTKAITAGILFIQIFEIKTITDKDNNKISFIELRDVGTVKTLFKEQGKLGDIINLFKDTFIKHRGGSMSGGSMDIVEGAKMGLSEQYHVLKTFFGNNKVKGPDQLDQLLETLKQQNETLKNNANFKKMEQNYNDVKTHFSNQKGGDAIDDQIQQEFTLGDISTKKTKKNIVKSIVSTKNTFLIVGGKRSRKNKRKLSKRLERRRRLRKTNRK